MVLLMPNRFHSRLLDSRTNVSSEGVIVKTQWVPGSGCVIISTNSTILSAMFIYSMSFDFIVLALAAWKLYDRRGHSQIVKLLFHDGLIYFTVA